MKFSGETTSGSISTWRDWSNKTYAAMWATGGEGTESFVALDYPTRALAGMLPKNVAAGRVTVYGGKTANKQDLLSLGVRILQDRFFNATIVSTSFTQGLGEAEQKGRWVRVSMSFLPNLTTFIGTAFNPLKAQQQMNLANNIILLNTDFTSGPSATGATPVQVLPGDVPPANGDPAAYPSYQNWNLPASVRPGDNSGSRGSWIGALITQALVSPARKPALNSRGMFGVWQTRNASSGSSRSTQRGGRSDGCIPAMKPTHGS